MKDEFTKKDVHLSEMEFQINNLLHQNKDLLMEKDKLKNELMRLENVYGNKVYELESQLEMESRRFDEVASQYNS